jgi:hypothetical protein
MTHLACHLLSWQLFRRRLHPALNLYLKIFLVDLVWLLSASQTRSPFGQLDDAW